MRSLCLFVTTTILITACGGETTAPAASSAAPGGSAPTITSPAGTAAADQRAPAVGAGESRYLTEALERGMGQIELAQTVSRNSNTEAIDAIAREIISANNEINAELARIAAESSVTLPADASAELRNAADRLAPLTGKNLDAGYLATLLQQLPELVRLHENAAATATSPALKEAAVRAQSLIEANLRRVRESYEAVTGVSPSTPPEPGSPVPASATTSSM